MRPTYGPAPGEWNAGGRDAAKIAVTALTMEPGETYAAAVDRVWAAFHGERMATDPKKAVLVTLRDGKNRLLYEKCGCAIYEAKHYSGSPRSRRRSPE